MVQINQTISRHNKHATYLESAPKVISIPCPQRIAQIKQIAIWTTRHKRKHFQSTRDKRILWTKSTVLMVRWPRMGPLPRHAFSNPINWRLLNISLVQTVPHPCTNTEGSPNVQGCEDRRIPHNRHPKYIEVTHNKHGTTWPSFGELSKYIWEYDRKFRNTTGEQCTNFADANHSSQHAGHTKGACSRYAQ